VAGGAEGRRAEVLTGVLVTLSEPASDQVAYLEGRSMEDDLTDLDVVQELLEELGDALEFAQEELAGSTQAAKAVSAVDSALRDPGLPEAAGALWTDAGWNRIRELAAHSLRVLRAEGLIADAIPFRLLPVQHASVLEPIYGAPDQWPAVVLTQAELDRFAAAWNKSLPEGIPASAERVLAAARRVYARYPEILAALKL
jgi:hypothetical protein